MNIDDLIYAPIPVDSSEDVPKTFKELCDAAAHNRMKKIEDEFKHLRGKLVVRGTDVVHKELADKAAENALILRVYNIRRIRRTRYGRR